MKNKTTIDLTLRCLSAIPRKLRIGFFTGCFTIFYHLYRNRRLVTINNLKSAFPEKDMAEIITITKGVYRTLGIVAAEFFDIPSLNKDNINDLVEIEGLEHCKKALDKNKGILMFGGHFGNWELFAIAFSLVLKPMVIIYRTLDNHFLDNLVLQVRSCTGNTLIDRKLAMRRLLRSLAKNEVIALLIDQNTIASEGVFVDFFGQPACTTNGIALLALHTGAPVIPAYIVRLSNGKYKMIIKEEMPLVRTGDQTKDVLINTQNFTRVIEDTIREYPDQWLWLHKRWRTKE